mmetsp:Transcript_65687/g.213820  ORF Transcript_65687/g.213820 Transcript_65687/m.213820 type:complete len:263 (-) Transcript_65687:26-814(-)
MSDSALPAVVFFVHPRGLDLHLLGGLERVCAVSAAVVHAGPARKRAKDQGGDDRRHRGRHLGFAPNQGHGHLLRAAAQDRHRLLLVAARREVVGCNHIIPGPYAECSCPVLHHRARRTDLQRRLPRGHQGARPDVQDRPPRPRVRRVPEQGRDRWWRRRPHRDHEEAQPADPQAHFLHASDHVVAVGPAHDLHALPAAGAARVQMGCSRPMREPHLESDACRRALRREDAKRAFASAFRAPSFHNQTQQVNKLSIVRQHTHR